MKLFHLGIISIAMVILLGLSGCVYPQRRESGLEFAQKKEEFALKTQETKLKTMLGPKEQLRFRLDYARLLMDQGRTIDALQLLDKLRRYPEIETEVYPLLAQSYERLREPEKALLAWQEAVKHLPGDRSIEAHLAQSALLEEKFKLADDIYQGWLKNIKDQRLYVIGLNNLGYSYILQHRYEQAAEMLNSALERDPLNNRARANLRLLEGLRLGMDAPATPDKKALEPLDIPGKKRLEALDSPGKKKVMP